MIINTFSSGLQLILPHLYSHLMTLIIVSLRRLKQFSANSSNFIYVHYIYIYIFHIYRPVTTHYIFPPIAENVLSDQVSLVAQW